MMSSSYRRPPPLPSSPVSSPALLESSRHPARRRRVVMSSCRRRIVALLLSPSPPSPPRSPRFAVLHVEGDTHAAVADADEGGRRERVEKRCRHLDGHQLDDICIGRRRAPYKPRDPRGRSQEAVALTIGSVPRRTVFD